MSVITKEDMRLIRASGVINSEDFKKLAETSRRQKLKRGETGYSSVQMRNFALESHTCSPEVRKLILDYFNAKVEKLKKVLSV